MGGNRADYVQFTLISLPIRYLWPIYHPKPRPTAYSTGYPPLAYNYQVNEHPSYQTNHYEQPELPNQLNLVNRYRYQLLRALSLLRVANAQ
jgi:hypothetical protein